MYVKRAEFVLPFLLTINTSMNDNIYKYQGFTLIDITKTDVTNYSKDTEFVRNQQRNWETIGQLLGLRAQLLELNYIGCTEEDLINHSFGVNFLGTHKVWSFSFAVDHNGIFTENVDRYGRLKDDFKLTPIILNLNETAQIKSPIFVPSGVDNNIYFKSLV